MVSQKQGYIDAVRGWAILLVITCHTGGVFPELPYPIRKLTNFGWHGVQLFFLASAVTLCMSWHNSQERGTASSYAFFVRRFLRIAPMYYVGALIYYIAEPPATGFDGWQLLRSFTFVNAWSPDWIPTTGGWMVVPGGWSIGVEVSFYLIFPILITFITSLARACLLFIVAIAAAWTFNHIGLQMLASYSDAARWNFLYFWFPNQFPIFALGLVLYHCIRRFSNLRLDRRLTYAIVAVTFALLAVVAEHPTGATLFLPTTPFPPLLLASLGFAVFVFVLSRSPANLLTHPVIRQIGVLSFSAYVLHFFFVNHLVRWSAGLIDAGAQGYTAIIDFALLWALTVPCTLLAARLANTYIEQPGIELARRLTTMRALAPATGG